MAAKYPYYLLADSPEGVRKEAELSGKIPPEYKTEGDIRRGFVCKRVPHVTLKSIANNPDIKEGMTREEIDAAIARHAGTEILHAKPYEDPKRIRVTGPFTVERLSPHRVIAPDAERPAAEREGERASAPGQFEAMILDNLRKAGVQNTKKNERLAFDTLDPFAGRWIHAASAYADAGGTTRRAAVSIGPEHGTVGPQQVQEAAKEAVQGRVLLRSAASSSSPSRSFHRRPGFRSLRTGWFAIYARCGMTFPSARSARVAGMCGASVELRRLSTRRDARRRGARRTRSLWRRDGNPAEARAGRFSRGGYRRLRSRLCGYGRALTSGIGGRAHPRVCQRGPTRCQERPAPEG